MAKDYTQLAQPYLGSVAELQDLLFPARTSTQLGDATDPINTIDKFVGKVVFNTTTSLPAFAVGAGATGVWASADITVGVDITPS